MKQSPKFLEIGFGALDDSIAHQLKKQGFKYKSKDTRRFENHKDSILFLTFGGYFSDKQRKVLFNKLFLKIKSHVKKYNP